MFLLGMFEALERDYKGRTLESRYHPVCFRYLYSEKDPQHPRRFEEVLEDRKDKHSMLKTWEEMEAKYK